MIGWLLGCPREVSEGNGATCLDLGPCSIELASATWSDGPPRGWAGFDLEAGTVDGAAVVLVGIPLSTSVTADPTSTLAALRPDLRWIGSFRDDVTYMTQFGAASAIAPSGSSFAVGASAGVVDRLPAGTVYLYDHLPQGEAPADDARLVLYNTVYGDEGRPNFGVDVGWADVDGGGTALLVGANSSTEPGAVFLFDPSVAGSADQTEARATLLGSRRTGAYLASWDADGDGVDELVTTIDAGVAHFPGPWVGDRVEDDADVVWTDADPANQLGEPLESVGDIDGDGGRDLAVGAQTWTGPSLRSGAMFFVPAGRLTSSRAEELPFQFLGTELGEGVGSATTSGDYDGDGATDLVIGAYGVAPGRQAGKVLGYLGPIAAGAYNPDQADFVVHGEALYDMFGSDVVTVDADGDTVDDLVVGAQGWNDWQGKVYLLAGSALLP